MADGHRGVVVRSVCVLSGAHADRMVVDAPDFCYLVRRGLGGGL